MNDCGELREKRWLLPPNSKAAFAAPYFDCLAPDRVFGCGFVVICTLAAVFSAKSATDSRVFKKSMDVGKLPR
jgi:hypothetical protein